jgi:hypothetical protein
MLRGVTIIEEGIVRRSFAVPKLLPGAEKLYFTPHGG